MCPTYVRTYGTYVHHILQYKNCRTCAGGKGLQLQAPRLSLCSRHPRQQVACRSSTTAEHLSSTAADAGSRKVAPGLEGDRAVTAHGKGLVRRCLGLERHSRDVRWCSFLYTYVSLDVHTYVQTSEAPSEVYVWLGYVRAQTLSSAPNYVRMYVRAHLYVRTWVAFICAPMYVRTE